MSPLEIFPGVKALAYLFKGVLLDAYGVFWSGNVSGPFIEAVQAMEWLVQQEKIVGILSNSTQLSCAEVEKLKKWGLLKDKHYHFLMTSGEVARVLFLKKKLPFETHENRFFVFGSAHPKYASYKRLFQGTPYQETEDLDEADFIYTSIPHIHGEDQVDPDVFREELEKIKAYGLPMLCANPDQFTHEGAPPRLVVRQGSIAKMYEAIGGRVYYIGKPYPIAYEAAMDSFSQYHIFNKKDVLMVGDNPDTDIRGAKTFGMPSALVTKTGIMSERITKQGFKHAVDNLQDVPEYFVERL